MKETVITFIVTKSCQLRCKYCYLPGKNNAERMGYGVASQVIDYLVSEKRIPKTMPLVLDFIGGEPLLEIELIERIIRYASSVFTHYSLPWKDNFRVRITTNGLLYNHPNVQRFIKDFSSRLMISISIDGDKQKNDTNRVFSDGQGSYDRLIECIPLWREQFPNEGTKMTISHDDLPYLYQSIVHLISLGICMIDVNPVLEPIWQEGDDKLFEEQLVQVADYIIDNGLCEKINISSFHESIGQNYQSANQIFNPCGSMFISVDSNGLFYTCLRFAAFGLTHYPPQIIGDIEHGINWNRMRPHYLFSRDTITPESCRKCEVADGCKMCPALNYDLSETQSMYQRNLGICRMHKAKVHAKNYYWNKLYNTIK